MFADVEIAQRSLGLLALQDRTILLPLIALLRCNACRTFRTSSETRLRAKSASDVLVALSHPLSRLGEQN